jgi:predicted  nucleic acid-binding Zn-ribbon protein
MVVQSLGQFEKNVGVSFSYVKKDLLSVNDSVSDLHDKIQHLSLNQAMLLEKVMNLERKLSAKKAKAVAKKPVVKKNSKKKVAKKPAKKIVKKETITYQ